MPNRCALDELHVPGMRLAVLDTIPPNYPGASFLRGAQYSSCEMVVYAHPRPE